MLYQGLNKQNNHVQHDLTRRLLMTFIYTRLSTALFVCHAGHCHWLPVKEVIGKWTEVTDDGQQVIVTAVEPPAQATQSKTTNRNKLNMSATTK